MEVVQQITADTLGRRCVITGSGKGPYIDCGMRPPTESHGRWLVSQHAVIAMSRLLGLPSGRDITTMEHDLSAITQQRDDLIVERDGLLRVVLAFRKVIGLEGIPNSTELDEAEGVVTEFEQSLAGVVATPGAEDGDA